MKLSRRTFAKSLAGAALARMGDLGARTSMGITTDSFQFSRRPKTALEFVSYCHDLGAAGAQAPLGARDPAYAQQLRQRCEELGMYLEISLELPQTDNTGDFERGVQTARAAGARCLRSFCLGGRRYEVFSDLKAWNDFVAQSKARLARAVPIVEKYKLPLGLENHKDWTVDEMLALMKAYESEYLGICIDTGNNIALLDNPVSLVESFAKYAVTTHFKDMAVQETPDGFLLAEVPLGNGFLDLRSIVQTISRARPSCRFTLEMITRNPLRIPCLSDKYWVTFQDRSGRYLAETLFSVRAHAAKSPLPRVDGLSADKRTQLEEDNVRRCLSYARDQLGLV